MSHSNYRLQITEKEITLYGFSDASESAYACDHVINLYAWTDSQVVLSWFSSPPRSWKPFIANRTAEILDLIPWNRWRYVPTKENPADIGSRGVCPKDLHGCRLWREGPTWLSLPEADWPKQSVLKDSDQHVLKERKKSKFVFSVCLKNDIDALIAKYSSYTKLIDVLAFCIRFLNNCMAGKANEHSTGKTGLLTSNERILEDNLIASYVQNVSFNEEIICIKANKQFPKNSSLSALCPFIDLGKLLRVGGRLQNALLQSNAKHPAILPNKHKIKAVLNPRPLIKLDDNDVDSLNVLTPSHFLIGDVITSPPEIVEEAKLSLKGRWDIVQKMKSNFLKRWNMDYLSSLQRNKWGNWNPTIKTGDVIIIKEDNIPPAVWPLGKVLFTHPGKDGVVRVH
ncbi:hypothetical protein AVEN_108837-1 [Araneus ventricosus]|uniref:DUF5641 domain-containing protein n=1 Tax=Araneus ventricosus TaxID=182803 RepID=A0A4Y2CDH6_ARAVE|nr:hypothetical protein AVEN_108837-1 [Araneus ventricosus]